jgi:hypothetical protein
MLTTLGYEQPKGANPHRLVFVADPQITDPHSYPGRPWPLSSLTVTLTDNYLRRGYKAMQKQLHPDSVFFLGDLFDGGREWSTRKDFVDPKWGRERSKEEKKWIKTWHRKYGEDYWAREYQRFSSIFFDNFNLGGAVPGPWQRGRRLVASLPGNHDLGFGAQVQVPVRDRFEAFFGDANRVDVVGNHTIVSVDTVSMSADTSEYKTGHNLEPIYGPANKFLQGVQETKRKLVQEELRVWHDIDHDMRFDHAVEELATADTSRFLKDPTAGATADFPTILLTHVPLYRDPGTPCGPMREKYPPSKPPKGQKGPVAPDDRNAISVAAGYQYQNVLNEEDSVNLIKSIGNVVHVFSGDDHDYCELVHSKSKGNVREITVKSMGMNMGVKSPGFLMLSMYNPVGADGKPIPGAPETTLQTHMCLLPNSFRTYMKYVFFVIFSLALLAVRALLVPVLHLEPFALAPEPGSAILPVFKDKAEPPDAAATRMGSTMSSSSNRLNASAMPVSRSTSSSSNGSARWASKKSKNARRWGWAEDMSGPRIKLDNDFYEDRKAWRGGRGKQAIGAIGREMWTTTWRVAWMVCLFWAHLTRKG